MKPKKILVICLRYLGDTLLTRPVLRSLALSNPQADLTVLVAPGTEIALEEFSHSIQVIPWPNTLLAQLKCAFHIFREKFDLTLDLTGNDRTALLTILSLAKVKVSYEKRKPLWPRLRSYLYNVRVAHEKKKPHILFQHQKLLEACHIPFAGTRLELKPSLKAKEKVNSLLLPYRDKKIILAHLTSRDMQKSLPIPLVREVVKKLTQENITIVFTQTKATHEKNYVEQCIEDFPETQAKLLPPLYWQELIALIAQVDIYWGVDTAPTHVASDLQKPMLVHYGPSHAAQWYPLNLKAQIIVSFCQCLKSKKNQCTPNQSGACFSNLESQTIEGILKNLLTS